MPEDILVHCEGTGKCYLGILGFSRKCQTIWGAYLGFLQNCSWQHWEYLRLMINNKRLAFLLSIGEKMPVFLFHPFMFDI